MLTNAYVKSVLKGLLSYQNSQACLKFTLYLLESHPNHAHYAFINNKED